MIRPTLGRIEVKFLGLLILASALLAGTPALAQDEDVVDDIIVVARRSGAPIWEVTREGATVLLVGEIRSVPKATFWSPRALEAATARSQRVMSGTGVQASLSDLFRLVWRMRTLTRLPHGTTSADWLEPEWQARLDAIEARIDEDYSRRNFLLTAPDLLREGAGFGRDTADDAGDVVSRAARRARVPVRSVQGSRGDELVENLLSASPTTRLDCMRAAIVAAEAGPEATLERGRAWTRFEVAAVMASPIQRAVEQCWPWGDPSFGPQLKTAWVQSIDAALTEQGVTMAVAPLGILAEEGGVLDRLQADGLTIEGPQWKAGASVGDGHVQTGQMDGGAT